MIILPLLVYEAPAPKLIGRQHGDPVRSGTLARDFGDRRHVILLQKNVKNSRPSNRRLDPSEDGDFLLRFIFLTTPSISTNVRRGAIHEGTLL